MGEFPSGQRGQTVNLLSLTSVVRIHLLPPKSVLIEDGFFIFLHLYKSKSKVSLFRLYVNSWGKPEKEELK